MLRMRGCGAPRSLKGQGRMNRISDRTVFVLRRQTVLPMLCCFCTSKDRACRLTVVQEISLITQTSAAFLQEMVEMICKRLLVQ